jgi:CopG antitoxin of type II toxin-antitoxin system
MVRSKRKPDPSPDHFDSLEEAAEFWDTHSTADYEEYMKEAHFDVDLKWIVEELRVAYDVMREVRKIAREQGLSTEALINLWLQQKVFDHRGASTRNQTSRAKASKEEGRALSEWRRSISQSLNTTWFLLCSLT